MLNRTFFKFVTIIAAGLLITTRSLGANYYVSSSTGSDAYTSAQAQNKTTPWQSINQINTFFNSIKAGDSILFKCGDTFTGTMQIIKSGVAGKPIVISSYGTGAQPIFSGMAPTSGWVSVGSGVFEGNCPLGGTTAAVVTLNGVYQQIGRYPNITAADSGYLTVASHSGGSQITSTQLNTAINWTGAEIVLRTNHWILDNETITSNTANTVNFTTTTNIPTDGFGFFIQNSPNTLDQLGEWYYNPTTKKVRMYFGATMPAGSVVAVGNVDKLIYSKNNNYVTIQNITFIGSNLVAVDIWNTNNYVIQNCTFKCAGANAIEGNGVNYFSILNNDIENSGNAGIYIATGSHSQILNNIVKNSGVVPGMGSGNNMGIYSSGVGNNMSNNDVENCGSIGISFRGDSAIVKNNYINGFSIVTDDSGGIYTGGSVTDTLAFNYGRQIVGNIVMNGHRATDGTNATFIGASIGIYCDDNSSGITISGNTVTQCPGGIKLHNPQKLVVTGNTFYNNDVQVISAHDQAKYTAKNNTFTNNIAFSKTISQNIFYFISLINDISRLGTFSGNYYSNYINNSFPFNVNYQAISLPMWQTQYSKDANSVLAVPIPYYTFTTTAKRNKFTNGTFSKNVTGETPYSVNGNFKTQWVNKLDAGAMQAYFTFISGAKNNGEVINIPIGALATGTKYMVKFSLKGTKRGERLWATLRNGAAPYNVISETQYAVIDTGRTENTFVFNPTTTVATSTVTFSFENEDNTLLMDNIGVYQTTATVNNPDDYLLFTYNNTTKSTSVKLAGKYVDAKNKAYSGTVALAPFTSLLLIKNADTIVTAPPVVYAAPDSSRNTLSVTNSTLKTAVVGVYPNPATNYLKFNFNDASIKDLNIKMLNTSGDVILNQKIQVIDNSYQLNFNTKPVPGCYFIQLTGSGFNQTTKVVII